MTAQIIDIRAYMRWKKHLVKWRNEAKQLWEKHREHYLITGCQGSCIMAESYHGCMLNLDAILQELK